MRVLVAPDKFKGTLSAHDAALAIARGLRTHGIEVVVAPVADGGEGTQDALLASLGGRSFERLVQDPLGRPVLASFALLNDGTAVIELAGASGLQLLTDGERDPRRSHTYGTGQLIREALELEPRRLVVALGGSATVDGGTGLASALGVRFLDSGGQPVAPAGGRLERISTIRTDGLDRRIIGAPITAAADVDTRLVDAARLFGPQKGLHGEQLPALERGLANLGGLIERDLGVAVSHAPGSGSAGGCAAMLLGLGATLRAGADVVLDAVRIDSLLTEVDVVITGEGRLDEGTAAGKAPAAVARRARRAGLPCLALVGEVASDKTDFDAVLSLADLFGDRQAALENAAMGLELLAVQALRAARM